MFLTCQQLAPVPGGIHLICSSDLSDDDDAEEIDVKIKPVGKLPIK